MTFDDTVSPRSAPSGRDADIYRHLVPESRVVSRSVRISIAIPTKNRLEYLRFAVESVLRQEYDDWEIIVADNCSDDGTSDYIAAIADARIRLLRSDEPLAVTDNWNRAAEAATGEYLAMLGDDDALCPGHLAAIADCAREFRSPDLIYTGAYLLTYPGARSDRPEGSLQPYGYAEFLRGREAPFLLDPREARHVVDEFLAFSCVYGFNTQFTTLSRNLIDGLRRRGPLYQSPFPDYYATNAAMLEASKIAVLPAPLVVIGVTPKSYGHFHEDRDEMAGRAFLGGVPSAAVDALAGNEVLPGTNINTSWLYAAMTLALAFPELRLQPDIKRYRRLQIVDVAEQVHLHGSLGPNDEAELWRHLRGRERFYAAALCAAMTLTRRWPQLRASIIHRIRYGQRQFIDWVPGDLAGKYKNVLELLDDRDLFART
jgi:glycosyltransferase involved in cell wall biosynthesis